MWLVAALAATAACIARKLNLRDAGGGATPRAARVVAPVLLIAALTVALAQTVVVAVLAAFARELHTDAVGATWLLTAFMLASAVATPIAGRLGDQYGHHRLIVAGLVLLILGSAIAAFSANNGWYGGTLTGRVIQGLAGGVFPCTFGLARQLLPSQQLPGVIAGLSAMFGVGGAVGMVAAGPLVDLTGLTSVFWLVASLALLALMELSSYPRPVRASHHAALWTSQAAYCWQPRWSHSCSPSARDATGAGPRPPSLALGSPRSPAHGYSSSPSVALPHPWSTCSCSSVSACSPSM
jgi:MFS family permease